MRRARRPFSRRKRAPRSRAGSTISRDSNAARLVRELPACSAKGGGTMTDALYHSIAEIARSLAEGELSARALAEEAIANHARFGDKLMAYSQWAPDHARQCAAAADAAFAIGARAGSLQGIPTSIKDLFAHSAFPTFAGSPKRLPAKFEKDGPVIARLREQVATVMGKTHM